MALRTNYKDDVFSGSRKYSMTTNPDTTVSFTDETQYTQQGDTYGAAQINEQNDHINNLDSHSFLDNVTAETSLADGDYLPFYDTSANAKRKVLLSKLKDFLLGALAPKVHDSNSAGTYGAATASKFGHVKLSNSYTSSDGAANNSVGASSQAVYDAYRNRAPINHASNATTYGRGSDSLYGHVMLSDAYESNAGAASAGMAASGKAVYDSYANLNGKINTANSNISGLSTRMGTAEGNITSVTSRTSTIENELTANNNRIYMDYKNGKYGYNTSANRGADTFHPFNDVSKQYYLGAIYIGNLTEGYSYVRAQYVVNNKSSNQTWGMTGRGTGTASLNGLSIITAYESQWVATVNSNKAGKLYENTSSGTSLVATFGSGGGQYVSTQHIQPGGYYGVSFYFEAD